MAIRFAVASANWSSVSTWDNGALPQSGDVVYPNGFTVNVDTGSTVTTITNALVPLIIPNISTPAMTSNTTPSGVAFAATNSSTAYLAFAQDGLYTTYWQSGVANVGVIGYQFSSGKVIKRYVIKGSTTANNNPTTWTFQGSNDGTSYTTLDTVTLYSMPASGNYTSGILSNTTSYTYYRLNILATILSTAGPIVSEFEMTESTGTVLGNNSGGTFNFNTAGVTFNTTNITPSVANIITITNTTGSLNINCTNNLTAGLNPAVAVSGAGNSTITVPNISVTSLGTINTIIKTGTGTLNIIGNIANNNNQSTNVLNIQNGIVNITGNISAGTALQADGVVMTAGTLNVTGNVTGGGGVSAGIRATPGTVTVTGNITGGSAYSGIYVPGASAVTVNGTITAGNGAPGITGTTNTSTIILSGSFINTNGFMAINCVKCFLSSSSTYWTMTTNTPTDRTLYTDDQLTGFPSTSNVRSGTVYGASGALTGTMIVPTPSNVRTGVATDNTVGTGQLTAADFLAAIDASVSGIGLRFKNIATVDTVGAQLVTYNV